MIFMLSIINPDQERDFYKFKAGNHAESLRDAVEIKDMGGMIYHTFMLRFYMRKMKE